ncbi:amidohydrolase family protein [Actinomadura sp. 9N407]|uniref:amidohydrolase family protein n=1 Tax=Actinomadura sp. 9N407 TaxID=3375154 RepID=UPI0037B92B2F
MTGLLLRDAEIDGRFRADVRVRDGRITEIGALTREPGESVLECGGGALLPGLCDHHLHLHALAARSRSAMCGPPAVNDPSELARALQHAAPDAHGWIRGVGYAETVAGDLDAATLDRLGPHRPVRVQHRSGALWTFNTAALAATGVATADHPGIERDDEGRPTGRLWRADDWLRTRLPPSVPTPLDGVARTLTGFGITAVTDATPDLGPEALAAFDQAVRDGTLPQRLHLLGTPLDAAPSARARVTTGPYKIVIADSGLPSLGDLTGRIAAAHRHGRPVAVHCVTREALFLLLAAFDEAGTVPGDRLEHAALIPAETIEDVARRELRVVTQPGFLADRGDDYLRDVPVEDHPDLYRCGGLLDAGIGIGLSSDAPYGPLDPWQVMDAAVQRRTRSGAVAGPSERITPLAALRAYLTDPRDPGGPVRQVRSGVPADLVLLHTPLAEALRRLDADQVRSVLIEGRVMSGVTSA